MDEDLEENENEEIVAFRGKTAKANHFKISVTKDQMEVKLYPLTGTTDGGLTTLEDVIDACYRENIKAELDNKLIEKQFLQINPTEVTIAKGIRPKDGKDGYIEFKVDMSAKPQFIVAEGKTIDYKNSMQVTLVDVGDILAVIIPPTEGESGQDVRGHAKEARAGARPRYFLGEGVEENNNNIIVTTPGTPSVQEDVIAIRRTFVWQGDVDLKSGNINFPGTVVIHGNVTDGFEVISDENVVINGLIAGAKIKAKGYVKCAGGIQGKNKAEIIAGSFVAATFVNAASIVAEGDVVITKDILHSNINCLGELRLGGSIIGGVSTAFKGVECGNLGSEAGVKTIVNIRTHYRQEKAKEQANSFMADVSSIFERYKIWNKLASLNEEEAKMLLKDIVNLDLLIKKRQSFDSRAAKFDQMVFENKNARVKLLGILEADVSIASPFSCYNSTAPIKGPLLVNENNSSAKMAIVRSI
jgi:uncharacterized protein (DUF342 family)